MMTPCLRARLHRFLRDLGRRFAQSAEDSAGVKPARAFLAEDLFPVDVAGLELADRGVAAVRASQRRAHAESALGKVQAVAHRAADAVVLDPLHMRLIDAALQHQVLDQSTHRIVGERRDDRRLQAEAATKAASDVILAAAFPGLKLPRGRDTNVARIEAKHHFPKADQIPLALFFFTNL